MKDWKIITGDFDQFQQNQQKEGIITLLLESTNPNCKVNRILLTKELWIIQEKITKTLYTFEFDCKNKEQFEQVVEKIRLEKRSLLSSNGRPEFGGEGHEALYVNTQRFFRDDLDELFTMLALDDEMISFLEGNSFFKEYTAKQMHLFKELQNALDQAARVFTNQNGLNDNNNNDQIAFDDKSNNQNVRLQNIVHKIRDIVEEIYKETGNSNKELFYIGYHLYALRQHEYAKWFLEKLDKGSSYSKKADVILAHIASSRLGALKENVQTNKMEEKEEEIRETHRNAIKFLAKSDKLMVVACRECLDYADAEQIVLRDEAQIDKQALLLETTFYIADQHRKLKEENTRLIEENKILKESASKNLSMNASMDKNNPPPFTPSYSSKAEQRNTEDKNQQSEAQSTVTPMVVKENEEKKKLTY